MNKSECVLNVIIRWIGLFGLVLVLPACIKTYKIFKDESPQGVEHTVDQTAINENLRSVRIYKEWQTVALFDSLLLSDDMRRLYVDVYNSKRGRDEEFKKGMLRRQLDENNHTISFFVLADVRAPEHEKLSDKDPVWTMYLQQDVGTPVAPLSIEEVELNPEISSFFGDRVTVYKVPYLVKFPRFNQQKRMPLKLVISSVDRECHLFWGDHPEMYDKKKKKLNRVVVAKKTPEKKKAEKYEDFYWL